MGALQNSVVIHCLYMVIVKYAMYYGPIKTTQKYTAENEKNAQCVTYQYTEVLLFCTNNYILDRLHMALRKTQYTCMVLSKVQSTQFCRKLSFQRFLLYLLFFSSKFERNFDQNNFSGFGFIIVVQETHLLCSIVKLISLRCLCLLSIFMLVKKVKCHRGSDN